MGHPHIVREFGEKSNYPKLTNGYFASDKYEAWEFAAIVVHLTNAIGVYRTRTDEGLQVFMVLTECIDNETAKKIKDRYIQCSEHEYRRVAFVCQHLNHTEKVGFNEAFETFEDMALDEEDDFQAWCDACETVREREDGWNEQSMAFAQIKLVCEQCYFEMKEFNLGYR